MAATGFAVGLGNIWRFPYITGEYGGATFVFVYLLCVLAIGVPLMIAEILTGRLGAANPVQTLSKIAASEGATQRWRHIGHLNLLTAFTIVGTYAVIAGWVIWYLFKALVTGFHGTDATLAATAFAAVQMDIGGLLLWSLLSLVFTGTIIFFGINKGIERSVKVLMPTLLALILALVAFNLTQPGFAEALTYLFEPKLAKPPAEIFLVAVGQAFFSIGVAMAGMMVFGAYLPKGVSITRCALIIIAIDTLVALSAGLMIFPIVFRFGLDPAGGVGLIFQTLPVAFAQMPGGQLVAIAFFTLLTVAAVTSMVGLTEPLVAWLEGSGKPVSRHRATLTVFAAVGTLTVISALSYNVIAGWKIGGFGLNGFLEYLSNQIMLPLGGLLIAIFAGWKISQHHLSGELPSMGKRLFATWHFLIRYVVPLGLAVILITGLI